MKEGPVKVVESVSVKHFYEKYMHVLRLALINSPKGLSRLIYEPAINRPGLAIAGFYAYFAHKRIQVFGAAEVAYLRKLPEGLRRSRVQRMYKGGVPCIIFARGEDAPPEILELADECAICVFKTDLVTMRFVNAATIILETEFAESTMLHGCMLDIRGIGLMIMGKSGVGKSETALGLIERGGSLVADDVVILRNVGGELIGSAPELSRGYMEVRGLGIVNVTNLFGMKALRREKRLDLIVSLKSGDGSDLDRLGLERGSYTILGVPVLHVELPVAPGRDTSRLVEVAALDQYLKDVGYDMAGEFNRQLMRKFSAGGKNDTE